MVYCVQAALAFSTATRRNNVKTAIETRINGKSRWDVTSIVAQPIRQGTNGLTIEMRFTAKADQADLATRMGELFPANPPLAGSFMVLHDCDHDENRNGCTVTSTQTW